MPFRMTEANATHQRLMNVVLIGQNGCINLDDVLVDANTSSEHKK